MNIEDFSDIELPEVFALTDELPVILISKNEERELVREIFCTSLEITLYNYEIGEKDES
jgi:hypothetical protein